MQLDQISAKYQKEVAGLKDKICREKAEKAVVERRL